MTGQYQEISKKPLEGFRYIIDDGHCTDHGYFLPKQPYASKNTDPKVEIELVPVAKLLETLRKTSKNQEERLKEADLIKKLFN